RFWAFLLFFFFSSRRRHTRFSRDWSSDVCSSDLVMRTLSKVGLAGLRLGLLIGDAAWLTEIEKIRLPYNINVLTQLSAEFALEKIGRASCRERVEVAGAAGGA